MPTRRFVSVITVLLLATTAARSQARYACEASPEIRQALERLPDPFDFRIPLEQRMAPLRALLGRDPRNIFVQQRYQDMFRRQLTLGQEFDRAFAMYRAQEDPVFRYLEARLTGSFHPAKAEQMLNALIARDPGFPWPLLAIAELTDVMGQRNPRKAEPHVRAFLGACPSSIEGYAMLRTVDDPDLIRTGAAKLRALLEARRDSSTLGYWRNLWDLEFRAAGPDAKEDVRRRVLKDAAALEKLPLAPSREWYWLFRYAYDLTKDESLQRWLEQTVLTRFPDSYLAVTIERERWSQQNPPPAREAKPEEWKAYQQRREARILELLKRWPNDATLLWEARMAVSHPQGAISLDQKLAVVDAFWEMLQKSPDAGMSVPPAPFGIAQDYVKWQVRLDRVPELVRLGQRTAEEQNKYRPDPSMIPAEYRRQAGREDAGAMAAKWSATILADLYLTARQLDEARDAIQQGLTTVGLPGGGEASSESDKRFLESERREWARRQGRLAELQGDKEKALTFYRRWLQPFPRQVLLGEVGDPETQERIAAMRQLYLDNGGEEDAWVEWAASGRAEQPVPAGPPPLEFTRPLADFEAKDLSGKTWRLADMKGKATLIDVWATWCGPCRGEHPGLQALYDKLRDRKDIQVLTFSIDENSYLTESYMKEKKYSFPVIVSQELTDRLFPVAGIPVSWIVDAQGRRSSRFFLSTVEQVIAELEKTAAAK